MLVATPPMGWNTWNTFGHDISEKLVMEMADVIVDLGLRDAGYRYVVVDDCWSEKQRDQASGRLVPDRNKFPSGMKALGDYIHSKGLKFGMYADAGVQTCACYPGSFDHEFTDAQTFADFGCDFLKYDFGYKPEDSNGILLYRRMANALRATGRDIVFSVCNWGQDDVWSWARSAGADMFRSTGDIKDTFESFTNIAKSQFDRIGSSGPHCFNDMDMLTVGMYGKGNVGADGCSFEDYRMQFALWCMMGSPLILGCDLRKLDRSTLELVKNRELISINQDAEARPPFVPYKGNVNGGAVTLAKLLSGGRMALALFNFRDFDLNVPIMFESIGFPVHSGYGLALRDVFTGEDIGVRREILEFCLKPHECRVFIAEPVRD